jgi:hypothetical protein
MAPIFLWMALHRALVNSFLLELSEDSSQSDASEHTPRDAWWRWRGFSSIDGTYGHPVGGEQRRRAQQFGSDGPGLGFSLADWRGQLLGLVLSGSGVHHQDPLHLKRRLEPRRCVWLNRSSGHGLASIVLLGERDATQRGDWFPATAPPFAGETLSLLERSPSMLRLQWG